MHTLQQRLAIAIHPLHQRIENNPLMEALHHKKAIEEPYRWLLAKLYRFVQNGEKKLVDLIPAEKGFSLERRLRLPLLQKDLTLLHMAPAVSDDDFGAIDTFGKAIGLLYVMEGSRKGGAFLSHLIEKYEAPLPMHYFIGYGPSTDQEWENFCELLEHYADTPLEQEIMTGAQQAFTILEKIFHHDR